MSDISKIQIPSGTEYNIKDTNAVASVAKSGSEITVTKRNGTTSSFGATKVVASTTQPTGGAAGDVWLVLVSY